MIVVTIEDRDVRDAMKRLAARLRDKSPVMSAIGERLVDSTRRRFLASVAPDGTAWAPNSPTTIERFVATYANTRTKSGALTKIGRNRAAGKKPLIGRGKRLSRDWSREADADSVTIGTATKYAAVHQLGARRGAFGKTRRGAPIPWGRIPARPFLGLSKADREAIIQIVLDYLRRAR